MYGDLEQAICGEPHRDAVLVSGESIEMLRAAYPNYFADTSHFVEVLPPPAAVEGAGTG